MLPLHKVKNFYRSLPPFLTTPLLFVPHRFFGGREFKTTLGELNKYDRIVDKSKRREFEELILCKFLSDAIRHVPYYRNWARSNGLETINSYKQVFDFPIINKEVVQERVEDFIDDRCQSKYPVYTGGTSGRQLKFFHSNVSYGREWAFLANFLSRYGVSIDEKRYSLRGVDVKDEGTLCQINPVYKELIISQHANTPENIEKIFFKISSFKGKWIHGYPSTVYQFCLALKEKKLAIPSIKSVLLVSEKLYDFQKDLIEEVLKAKIISFYGMSERVVFAPLTTDGFIPHRCYGVSEIIDGEHVATGFINNGTCLIRYKTGDCLEGKLDSDGLVQRFSSFEGRWGGDSIVGLSGVKINMTVLNTHSELLNGIQKYQFRQSTIGQCDLLLQSTKPIPDDKVTSIQKLFQAKLGKDIKLSCKLVDKVEVTSRGKHKFVHSAIKGS